eukprot:710230-Pleurochrysis_carterae.AAC.2
MAARLLFFCWRPAALPVGSVGCWLGGLTRTSTGHRTATPGSATAATATAGTTGAARRRAPGCEGHL